MSKNGNFRIFLIVSIVILLLGSLVALYFLKHNPTKQIEVKPPTEETEGSSSFLTYSDSIYGFAFEYPASLKYIILSEDPNCCGKIVFLPLKSTMAIYNGDIPLDVVETIAPITVNINKITGASFDIDTYISSEICNNNKDCKPSDVKGLDIGSALDARQVIKSGTFPAENYIFEKPYQGTAPTGTYFVTISLREDQQTAKLYPQLDSLNLSNFIKNFRFLAQQN